MIKINENYLKINKTYLFENITKKVLDFQNKNPHVRIIKLGIGDVTRSLPEVCINAFNKAISEMGEDSTFRGYGPPQGFKFLRNKIAFNDFQKKGISISGEEIFINDGSKTDTANIQEIFSKDSRIAIPDPVYPVYLDTNVMAGRTGKYNGYRYDGVIYLESTSFNNFIPEIPTESVDLIYLCFPNNPTGTAISKKQLGKWVDFAIENKALILYDAAYEAFVKDDFFVRSIYEIKGAEKVSIEFRSFSKNVGFTGIRCGYTVVPKECLAYTKDGTRCSVHNLWNRRQITKFNGVSYPVQRAAEAVFSNDGCKEIEDRVDYYMLNARLIRKFLRKSGFKTTGGINAPYVWFKINTSSWAFFNLLLKETGVVCTPGSGFGNCGKGYIRMSAFNSHENVKKAIKRIKANLDNQLSSMAGATGLEPATSGVTGRRSNQN